MIPHYAIAWMTKLHTGENLGCNYSSMAESMVTHTLYGYFEKDMMPDILRVIVRRDDTISSYNNKK